MTVTMTMEEYENLINDTENRQLIANLKANVRQLEIINTDLQNEVIQLRNTILNIEKEQKYNY